MSELILAVSLTSLVYFVACWAFPRFHVATGAAMTQTLEFRQAALEFDKMTEVQRYQRLLRLVCEWQDQENGVGIAYGMNGVFLPNNEELDKVARGRTGGCARQLLRTLAGLE